MPEVKTRKISASDINKEPILKCVLEYQNTYNLFSEEEKMESENLETSMKAVKELEDLGIYDHSMIAIKYKNVCENYKRILWIYSKILNVLNDRFLESVDTTEKEYISKQEHEYMSSQYIDKIKSLQIKKPIDVTIKKDGAQGKEEKPKFNYNDQQQEIHKRDTAERETEEDSIEKLKRRLENAD